MSSNMSKPFQAQLIAPLFPTPPTLVTNEPDDVRDFVARHGRVIYKSISSVRSIVREWQPRDERALGRIRALPTQFQRFIEGTNIRVHVVGDKLFATEVEVGTKRFYVLARTTAAASSSLPGFRSVG